MRRIVAPIAAVLVMIVVAAAARADELVVPIVVSPSTINLQAAGTWVTVHAEIDFADVVGISVTLNGLPVKATFADNRGDLVAKFVVGAVRGIVEPGTAELKLCGQTDDGGTFSGTDLVRVINVSGK